MVCWVSNAEVGSLPDEWGGVGAVGILKASLVIISGFFGGGGVVSQG